MFREPPVVLPLALNRAGGVQIEAMTFNGTPSWSHFVLIALRKLIWRVKLPSCSGRGIQFGPDDRQTHVVEHKVQPRIIIKRPVGPPRMHAPESTEPVDLLEDRVGTDRDRRLGPGGKCGKKKAKRG